MHGKDLSAPFYECELLKKSRVLQYPQWPSRRDVPQLEMRSISEEVGVAHGNVLATGGKLDQSLVDFAEVRLHRDDSFCGRTELGSLTSSPFFWSRGNGRVEPHLSIRERRE